MKRCSKVIPINKLGHSFSEAWFNRFFLPFGVKVDVYGWAEFLGPRCNTTMQINNVRRTELFCKFPKVRKGRFLVTLVNSVRKIRFASVRYHLEIGLSRMHQVHSNVYSKFLVPMIF